MLSMNKPSELPELTIRQQNLLNGYLKHGDATKAYIDAGYTAKHANRAAFQLINRSPIKDCIDYYRQQAKKITFEMKSDLLWRIAQESMQPLEDDDGKVVKWGDKDVAIKAIAELNKMVGDYAPVQTQVDTRTVNVTAAIEDIRNARLQYKQDK